ncbi:MAG: diguanylate cyclase [Candidatus Thiodiazotropha lotti]|nr:diguanylate cyclase [Candidatus Thiodiazotropha lotti]
MSLKSRSFEDAEHAFSGTQKTFGRSIAPLILALILLSMVSLIALAAIGYFKIDDQVQGKLLERAHSALQTESLHLEYTLLEYSYWDEAYQGLINTQSAEFIEDSITDYLFDTYSIKISLALDVEAAPLVAHVDGQWIDMTQAQIDELGVSRWVKQVAKVDEYPFIVSGIQRYQGALYMIQVGRFINYDSEMPEEDGSSFLVARLLDQSYLDNIAERYHLPGLRLTSETNQEHPLKMALTQPQTGPVMGLWWREEGVVNTYIDDLIPAVLVVIVLLVGITWLVIRRDHENRQNYVNQLFELASKDFLTGVSNRREFFHLAERELNRSKRDRSPMCLLMMDIDNFKKINDSLGHEGGDKVLSGFTHVVQKNLRSIDVLARIGGEEFSAILVTTDKDTALDVAERIRHAVNIYPFPEVNSAPVQCTVSVGLAHWDGEESLSNLLNRGDEALYCAKGNGRNQVSIAEPI